MSDNFPPNPKQDSSIVWRPIPKELRLVDNGEYADRIEFMRLQSPKLSPDEIHMSLDPVELKDSIEVQFLLRMQPYKTARISIALLFALYILFLFGLSVAAYNQNIYINPKITFQPFLKQWMDGFPEISSVTIGFLHIPIVLNSWHMLALSSIIFFSIVYLAMLFFLTILIQRIDYDSYRKIAYLGKWLKKELDLLSKASLIRSFGQGPENMRPMWAVELHSALNQLLNVQKQTGNGEILQVAKDALIGNQNSSSVDIDFDAKGDIFIQDNKTSKVIEKLPQQVAYDRIVHNADETRKQLEQIHVEGHKQAKRWSLFSLLAAILGFIVVISGIITMLTGYVSVGAVTALGGIVSELAAALFFRQTQEANKRVDDIRIKLHEAEKIHEAMDLALAVVTDPEAQNRLKEIIILHLIGLPPKMSGKDLNTASPKAQ